MTTPDKEDFIYELELDVRAELIQVETSQSQEDADRVQVAERVPDTDAQRYEIRLRNLLGAAEALEHRSGPADESPRAEFPESDAGPEQLPHGLYTDTEAGC